MRIRPAGGGSSAGSATTAPGAISSYWPGKNRWSSSPVAALLAVRSSIRPKNTSTSMRATWVERTRSTGSWKVATLSDWEWRSAAEPGARGERLMDVDEVERDGSQQPLERAADVDRERRRPPSRPARERDALADRENPRVLRLGAATPDSRSPPGSTAGSRGSRVRDSDGATIRTRCPRSGELVGRPLHELVDLVPGAPGMGVTCAIARESPLTKASLGKRSHRSGRPSVPAPLLGLRLGLLGLLVGGQPGAGVLGDELLGHLPRR